MPSSTKKSLSNLIHQLAAWLPKQWQTVSLLQFLLLPMTIVFFFLVRARQCCYRIGLLKQHRLPVPVVVVGNITVGGAGKTPLTIALVNKFKTLGLKPGVISRGYGREGGAVAAVIEQSCPTEVGDESLLIARRTQSPIYVGSDRFEAGQALLANHPECNVIVSDDGLQHYQLARDYELVVVDGARGFGNHWLLPAGPLREPVSRLASVDAIICNQQPSGSKTNLLPWKEKVYETHLETADLYQLVSPHKKASAAQFEKSKILAAAGIGHPQRFFNTLTALGLTFIPMAYADHYEFTLSDFGEVDAEIIILTEKDAVKCEAFADERYWVLPVNAVLPAEFITSVLDKLQQIEEEGY